MKMPKQAQPKPVRTPMNGTSSMPQLGSSPNTIATSSGAQPNDAGARGDPQRLGGDELLGVDGRGEDRVVGALELVLDERAEHRREDRREQHRRGDRPGADELDVVVAADRRDERAEAEAEREQVDRRLDRRGERARLPERGEVDDLAHEHAHQRGALEAAERRARGARRARRLATALTQPPPRSAARTGPRGSPARRSPSGVWPFARSTPSTLTDVPVRRVLKPAARASASASASRAGGP